MIGCTYLANDQKIRLVRLWVIFFFVLFGITHTRTIPKALSFVPFVFDLDGTETVPFYQPLLQLHTFSHARLVNAISVYALHLSRSVSVVPCCYFLLKGTVKQHASECRRYGLAVMSNEIMDLAMLGNSLRSFIAAHSCLS